MRDHICVPADEFIWKPAMVLMERAGTLELDVTNADQAHHIAFVPSDGERQVLDLPAKRVSLGGPTSSAPGWSGIVIATLAAAV